jgi:hypothetical protein
MDLSHYIGQKAVKRPVKALIDVAKGRYRYRIFCCVAVREWGKEH